jgi:predicted DNA-binding protein with PD1-like motif
VLAEFHGPGPRTGDNLHALEVLTYDGLRVEVGPTSPDELDQIIRAGGRRGEIYRKLKEMGERNADLLQERYPNIVRRVSGYADLDQFIPGGAFNVARALAGSEGTCAVTLEATVHLIDEPPYTALLVAGYPDVFAAGDHIPLIRDHQPMGLEGMDSLLVDYVEEKVLTPAMVALDLLPEGNGFLLMEFKLLSHNKDNGERTYAIVFDQGDECMEILTGFANDQEITAATFTAVGAFEKATLAFFNMETNEYEEIPVQEQVEVLSFMGNVALHAEKNEPKVHAHAVLGKRDGATLGGHMMKGHVRPTLEVLLIESPEYLHRRVDDKTGLALIDIGNAVGQRAG